MSDLELSQCRVIVMKAQWRALQTAPQYAARIGVAASSLKDPSEDPWLATFAEAYQR